MLVPIAGIMLGYALAGRSTDLTKSAQSPTGLLRSGDCVAAYGECVVSRRGAAARLRKCTPAAIPLTVALRNNQY